MLYQEHSPDGVRLVVLAAGRGNALGPKLLAEIERAFDPDLHEIGPVVLAGRGRSFCTGLDLIGAWDFDRDRMRDLMERFHRALRAVLLWPAPVIARIQGHALAGGALLAFCADRRVMAHGDGRFGIHGVQLGVVYPQIAVEVLRWRLSAGMVERVLYGGQIRPGHDALAAGLVDELVETACPGRPGGGACPGPARTHRGQGSPDRTRRRAGARSRSRGDGSLARPVVRSGHEDPGRRGPAGTALANRAPAW